jgi:hypothetical protein
LEEIEGELSSIDSLENMTVLLKVLIAVKATLKEISTLNL